MKNLWITFRKHVPWLLLILLIDGFCIFLLWIVDARALGRLSRFVCLFSILLFMMTLFFVFFHERKKEKVFQEFLAQPDRVRRERLLSTVSLQERLQLEKFLALLEAQQTQLIQMKDALHDYEEYVEGWAHETKTPLSLFTMLLDNRQDELPLEFSRKLNYVRSQLHEDVTQMLYYARLKSSTKDYRFAQLCLKEIVNEVLEEYEPLLEEKSFQIRNYLQEEQIFNDYRGVRFLLGQIISNAIKYASITPKLTISMQCLETERILCIRDNGIGIRASDLPYIFQKGFTGDSTDRQKKATGMGLYLAKKMADDLKLTLDAHSKWGEGCEISIAFPRISNQENAMGSCNCVIYSDSSEVV